VPGKKFELHSWKGQALAVDGSELQEVSSATSYLGLDASQQEVDRAVELRLRSLATVSIEYFLKLARRPEALSSSTVLIGGHTSVFSEILTIANGAISVRVAGSWTLRINWRSSDGSGLVWYRLFGIWPCRRHSTTCL
jgi:hypothetical protein